LPTFLPYILDPPPLEGGPARLYLLIRSPASPRHFSDGEKTDRSFDENAPFLVQPILRIEPGGSSCSRCPSCPCLRPFFLPIRRLSFPMRRCQGLSQFAGILYKYKIFFPPALSHLIPLEEFRRPRYFSGRMTTPLLGALLYRLPVGLGHTAGVLSFIPPRSPFSVSLKRFSLGPHLPPPKTVFSDVFPFFSTILLRQPEALVYRHFHGGLLKLCGKFFSYRSLDPGLDLAHLNRRPMTFAVSC